MRCGFIMLEHACTRIVSATHIRTDRGGQRRRRPERTRFLVADVYASPLLSLSGVIVPSGQPELVRVFHPGNGAPTLADDSAM